MKDAVTAALLSATERSEGLSLSADEARWLLDTLREHEARQHALTAHIERLESLADKYAALAGEEPIDVPTESLQERARELRRQAKVLARWLQRGTS